MPLSDCVEDNCTHNSLSFYTVSIDTSHITLSIIIFCLEWEGLHMYLYTWLT